MPLVAFSVKVTMLSSLRFFPNCLRIELEFLLDLPNTLDSFYIEASFLSELSCVNFEDLFSLLIWREAVDACLFRTLRIFPFTFAFEEKQLFMSPLLQIFPPNGVVNSFWINFWSASVEDWPFPPTVPVCQFFFFFAKVWYYPWNGYIF